MPMSYEIQTLVSAKQCIQDAAERVSFVVGRGIITTDMGTRRMAYLSEAVALLNHAHALIHCSTAEIPSLVPTGPVASLPELIPAARQQQSTEEMRQGPIIRKRREARQRQVANRSAAKS